MISALRVCSKCGAEIFADAAEGLCTACLLETGLGLFAEPVARIDDTRRADQSPLTDIAAANGSRVAAFDRGDARDAGRLRIAGGNRARRPGRSLSRPTEKS